MKSWLSLLIAVLPVAVFAGPPQTDIKQPASPTLPKPDWVKIVDHGKYDPRLKGYMAPEGLKIEIVAEEPTIINPVGMTFGNDGTFYVLEWRPSIGDEWRETPETFIYKDGTRRSVATMKKHTKDVLKVLKWNADTKLYDQAEIIIEDELPSSILLYESWIYLSSRGTVRRYRKSKPGGQYDTMEIIAQGFCGFHHHQVSGMTMGPDGWLYITAGDDDNYVEGSDGSRATVLRTGAVFRCKPDGSQMQTYSIGYRNPYRDIAFDTGLNWFHVDNDNEDGSKFTGCRLMHVAEEADFGWRLFQGARCCKPDHVRGAVFGELPGKMPAMLKTGRGSPAGLLIYNDTQLPEEYRGLLYYPDVFRKLIRAYRVTPDGSTFQAVEEFEFLKSDDPLFRPCQMIVGPDGAMYVCDWRTDSGGAGKLWGDGKHGRIYRISWRGTDAQPAIALRKMTDWSPLVPSAAVDLLQDSMSSPNFSTAVRASYAMMLKAKVDPASVKQALLHDAAPEGQCPATARRLAMGALQSVWDDEVRKFFYARLTDADPDVRRLAAEGLALACKPGDAETQNELTQVLYESDPAVKRAIVLAIGKIGAPGAGDALINMFRADHGKDLYLSDGIIRALERVGERGVGKLVDLAESGVTKDIDRVVDAFLTLRTRAGAKLLPDLLKNPHLKSAQRAELLRSYGNYLFDPPMPIEPVVDVVATQIQDSSEVKKAAVEVLALFGAVSSEKAAGILVSLIRDADPEVRLQALKTVETARISKAVPVLIERIGNDSLSVPERIAIVKALRGFNDKSAVAPLTAKVTMLKPTTAEQRTLRLEAFRTLAQLDAKAALSVAENFLDQPGDLQNEVIQLLGTQPAGAKKAAELFIANKLPRETLPLVTEGLRKHLSKQPELGKLLTEVMRGGLLVSLDKAQIEKVQGIVKSKGNPARGRELFLNSKILACVNCHRLEGVGGNVGPDLTRIWETQSLEKIMESMIDPSKEIKEGYQSYRLTTQKGQTFTGLKVAQNAVEVVIKDSTGKELHFPAKDVDELEVSKMSLMPDNVISQLTFEQFIDLVAFLRDRPAQESLRGLALDFWTVGPFGEDWKKSFAPEKQADRKAVYEPGKLAWQAISADPKGYVDLRAIYGKDHISAYALTYVYSLRDQKVTMLAGAKDPIRIWVNGGIALESEKTRPAKADQDRATVALKAGWNPVLVKSLNGMGAHGFYLRFAEGEGIRVSSQPEAK